MKQRNLFLFCAIAWAGVIFYLSHLPGVDVPPLFFGKDKLFHAIVFGVLGFFTLGAMKMPVGGRHMLRLWLAIAVVIGYGVLDEFHQHFVPGRTPDIYDVMADAVGGMLGVWLSSRLFKARVMIRNDRLA